MGDSRAKWVLRREGGELRGPFETEAILKMIREGQFTGNELISRYPDGQWTFISREPEFYDSMLDAIEAAIHSSNQKPNQNSSEETLFMPPPPSSAAAVKVKTLVKDQKTQSGATSLPMSQASSPIPKPPVIEMDNLSRVERAHFYQALKRPLAVVLAFALVIILLIFFLSSSSSDNDKISLIAPREGKSAFSDSEIKKRYAAATTEILKDNYENYIEAQNKLVTLVEGTPAQHPFELAVRGALCLVYKELWPFAKQDANDMRVVAQFTQVTRARNVISGYGNFCEIVKLLTSGRFKEARGATDLLLENNEDETFSMKPILYGLKGELLENEKDFQFAAAYYEKAAQDLSVWVKPRSRLGLLYLTTRDYKKSSDWFREALRVFPDHKASKIGLGMSEYYGFRQTDKAFSMISEGLKMRGKIPSNLESDSYQVLAEIYLEKNDKSAALEAAQKSYVLNSNNDVARQLLLRLGGSDKIAKADKTQNNELMFLGDQYARQGDCLAAQAEYKAAYEADKMNAMAAMKAGKCLWQLNQSYEAVDWLNRAIRSDSKLVPAYILKADYLSQRFDFDSASQTLATASRMVPQNYEVMRGMALLELRKGNFRQAIALGQRAIKIYDGDIDSYIVLAKASLGLVASISASSMNGKEAEARDQAMKDAIRYADRAVEIDSTSSEAQIVYAQVRGATAGTDSAIGYLKEMIRKYSYSSEYKIALAEIMKRSERWADARVVYQQVVEQDPRNKTAWLGLGESLKAVGETESSLKAFLNAAVIDPMDGEALFQAGKLYFESSRFEESLQQFLRVKNLNVNFPRANYYAGKAAFALGRFKEALDYAQTEKKMNPNLADPTILMAEIYDAQGAFQECAAEYSAALKLRPGGAEIYVKAARCYRQAGSLDIAETMLTLAKDRESGYAAIYKELGALFERRGDNRAARVAYKNFLELAPNAPDRKEIEIRLMRLGGGI